MYIYKYFRNKTMNQKKSCWFAKFKFERKKVINLGRESLISAPQSQNP